MFGYDSLPSRIYSYDCEPPTNIQLVADQIYKAHVYRNKLVEIELARRAAITQSQMDCYPMLAEITTQIEALTTSIDAVRDAVKTKKQTARSRVDATMEKEQIKEWTIKRKELRERQKSMKADTWAGDKFRAMVKQIDDDHAAKVRAARKAAVDDGIYWGNYLAAEKSVPRTGRPPKFHRWNYDGKVSLQVQGGMSIAECFAGDDQRLRIVPPANMDWTRRRSNPDKWTTTSIRIGSKNKGKPIWATVEFCMHRPIPADAQIKEAYLVRRQCGPRGKPQWKIQFVVAREAWEPKATGTGCVGIDVGWRLFDDGLRVAYAVGDDGRHWELILPTTLLSRWKETMDLQFVRDKNFEQIIKTLREFIGGHTDPPAWLLEDTKFVHAWKGKGKLVMLLRKWEQPENRFDGDVGILADMVAWIKQEHHLWQWQENNRRKGIDIRNRMYSEFVAELRKHYCRAAIEDTNWRDMKRVPVAESDKVKFAGQLADIAAVGKLLACAKESMAVTRCDPQHTTKRCHVCEKICDFDAITEVRHQCEWCGAEWDQDENAAYNLLQMLAGTQHMVAAV